MKPRTMPVGRFHWFITCLFAFVAWQCHANTIELDWDYLGFYTSHITINVGDEVDIVNLDDTFDLRLTSGPAPENFTSDIPPTDTYVYYLPVVYNTPGTYNLSDEFGDSATVTVNSAQQPLSVTITDPTNNAAFTAPATFTVTAVPTGGATPYSEMQFFVGTNLVGDIFNPPFTSTITNLPVGTYNINVTVIDNNFNTATNSILVNIGSLLVTNYIVPAACGNIYSSGNVTGGYLSAGTNPEGALEFAVFNASQYTSILLEVNPYGLPLFGTNVSVYGFDGGNGTIMSSNYNSGTLIGVWALPPGLGYGQVTTFDVTAFVKSAKGPYFGFLLVADGGGDLFSSTTINYGIPPELYAISPPLPPQLTATRSGNQIIVSWPTNNADGLSLHATTTFGPEALWNTVSLPPALLGNQWVVTNPISGPGQFFRLSSQ